MTRHNTTPTQLTNDERDELRSCLRQNLGYRAWVIEDTILGHIDGILAARGNNTAHEILRAAVEEVLNEYRHAASIVKRSSVGTGDSWWDRLNSALNDDSDRHDHDAVRDSVDWLRTRFGHLPQPDRYHLGRVLDAALRAALSPAPTNEDDRG